MFHKSIYQVCRPVRDCDSQYLLFQVVVYRRKLIDSANCLVSFSMNSEQWHCVFYWPYRPILGVVCEPWGPWYLVKVDRWSDDEFVIPIMWFLNKSQLDVHRLISCIQVLDLLQHLGWVLHEHKSVSNKYHLWCKHSAHLHKMKYTKHPITLLPKVKKEWYSWKINYKNNKITLRDHFCKHSVYCSEYYCVYL